MNPRDIWSLKGLRMRQGDLSVDVDTLGHHLIDDVYIKPWLAKKAGTFLGQHAHAHAHGTLVASGVIRLFLDEQWAGDFKTGDVITIKAGRKHILLALEDNTCGVCIHNVHGESEPRVLEETTFADVVQR